MRFVGLGLALAPLLLIAQEQTGDQQPAATQPTRPEDKCSVEGQVVNAQTGDPVKKARVRLYSNDGRNNNNYSATADAGGHYSIQEIAPGSYNLFADRNGFIQAQYGARSTNRAPTPLTLNPGQRVRDVNFRLIPHGVITGRVLDEDGEPVEHVQVMATRSMRGRRQMGPAGYGQTDDLGEYRIFGLEPGRYYLSATYRRQNMMAEDRTPGAAADENYAPTYYPGTSDPAGAVALDVAAAAQLRGMDLTLVKKRTMRIRGKVINPLGERQTTMITLLPREKVAMSFYPAATTQVRNADGTFELRGVVPGAYVLIAQCANDDKFYMVQQHVDVGNNNVDNLSLMLAAGLELKGTVRVDGPGDTPLGNVQVSLASQEMMRKGMQGAKVGDDGSFTLSNVPATLYTVYVNGIPETFYIKSIHMGDADALEAGLDLSGGGADALDIVLSPNGGQVDGTVTDSNQQAASQATVVLAPEGRRREQASLFKVANTDTQGHFTIKGIAPGDYKLFAWDQIDDGDYQDPEFLKSYENQGEAVAIRESAHENVQLKLIETETKAGKAAN